MALPAAAQDLTPGSIVRAKVTEPRLILIDELFAALDEITRQKLNNDLQAMQEQVGCVLIFVTYSVFDSVFLSDRSVVMAPRLSPVVQELVIDAPYPRGVEIRMTPIYADPKRWVSHAMGHAVREPA